MEVFFSHHGNDRSDSKCPSNHSKFYEPLLKEMEKLKVTIRDLNKEITPGDRIEEKLREAIRDCPTCLFFATPYSLKSQWCLAELGAFWGAKKKVIIYKPETETELKKIPPQFDGIKLANNLDDVTKAFRKFIEDAKEIPSFEMSLWRPFKHRKCKIVVPRISLRDSWNLNSEEVGLILGPLKFLGIGEKDDIVRLKDIPYENDHLIVLGAPHLDKTKWDYSSVENDRIIHHKMLNCLLKSLDKDFPFELYRKIVQRKDSQGKKDYARSGIIFGNEERHTVEGQTGSDNIMRVKKDVGIIARMNHPNEIPGRKALWAFGFTAPGTGAALTASTQQKLSQLICEELNDPSDNFAALFEVEIDYDADCTKSNRASPKKTCFVGKLQPLNVKLGEIGDVH